MISVEDDVPDLYVAGGNRGGPLHQLPQLNDATSRSEPSNTTDKHSSSTKHKTGAKQSVGGKSRRKSSVVPEKPPYFAQEISTLNKLKPDKNLTVQGGVCYQLRSLTSATTPTTVAVTTPNTATLTTVTIPTTATSLIVSHTASRTREAPRQRGSHKFGTQPDLILQSVPVYETYANLDKSTGKS